MDETVERGRFCRRLLRSQRHAALATSLIDGSARPYSSLVAVACDMDASPLLLLSSLAQHSRNIAADNRISLLFDGEAGLDGGDPLAAPRLSLIGEAASCDDERLRRRFVACHPSAAQYSGFSDFRLYRIEIARGHLVAGFGRISWVERDELRLARNACALAEAEAEIVAHMNADHADALVLYAARLLQRPGTEWGMTGIDPEGIDLRCGDQAARLDFADSFVGPVFDADSAGRRWSRSSPKRAASRIRDAGPKVASYLPCLPVDLRRVTVRAKFWYLAPTGPAATRPGLEGGKLGKDGQPGDGPEAVL